MELFKIFGTLGLKGVSETQSDLDNTVDKAESSSNAMSNAFAKIGTAVVSYFAAEKIISFGQTCIETAAAIKASNSQFQQTFTQGGQDLTRTAEDIINKVGEASGIIATRLKDSGTKIYAFAKSSGADSAEALSLMETALTAAADTAAYYDVSLESATETLQSFLKGNFANDAALGVSCTEVTRNAAAVDLFGKEYAELTEIQKQQTLLKMVTDAQTLSGAMGQAAREADGWENVMGNLKEVWRQFLGVIGSPLLEAVIPIIQGITNNFDAVSSAIVTTTAVVGVLAGGKGLTALIRGFQTARVQLSCYTLQNGKAAIAQGAFNGSLTLGKIAVGVLTGQISLATVAQNLWNTAIAANPIGILIAAVGLLGTAIYKTQRNAVDKLTNSFAKQAESIEEAEANLADLKAQLEELPDDMDSWSLEERQRYEALCLAIQDTESQIDSLRQEQQALAAEASDPATQMQASVESFSENVGELFARFQETYEGMYDTINGWFEPFEEAKTTVTTSVGEMIAAMQSQVEFNNAYAENLQMLREYGLGGLAEGFQTLGPDAAAYAQTIVAAVEQAGGASTEAGQAIIQEFKTVDADVQASQENLATNMTLISEDWGTAIEGMVQTLADNVEGLNMDEEALAAAQSTLDGYMDGVEAKYPEIQGAMAALGELITSSLQASIGTVYVPVVQTSAGSYDGSHAGGLDRVPFDGYIAQLHKDETVLTAEEAKAWRAGKTSSGSSGNAAQSDTSSLAQPIEIVLNITSEIDGATLARKTYKYNLLEQRNHGTSLINA